MCRFQDYITTKDEEKDSERTEIDHKQKEILKKMK